MGVGCGRGVWAWGVGVGCGRGVWACRVCVGVGVGAERLERLMPCAAEDATLIEAAHARVMGRGRRVDAQADRAKPDDERCDDGLPPIGVLVA